MRNSAPAFDPRIARYRLPDIPYARTTLDRGPSTLYSRSVPSTVPSLIQNATVPTRKATRSRSQHTHKPSRAQGPIKGTRTSGEVAQGHTATRYTNNTLAARCSLSLSEYAHWHTHHEVNYTVRHRDTQGAPPGWLIRRKARGCSEAAVQLVRRTARGCSSSAAGQGVAARPLAFARRAALGL